MSLTIRERTTSLVQFLIRLAGIVGGVLGEFDPLPRLSLYIAERLGVRAPVCSDYGFRTADFLISGLLDKNIEPLPGFPKSPRPRTPKL